MIAKVVRRWWWEQEAPVERLAITRLVAGAALLRATWHLPPAGLYAREAPLLDAATGQKRVRLRRHQYETARWVSLATLVAWTLGSDHPAVRVAANGSTLLVHWQNASLDARVWNYSTQLHAYLALLSALSRQDQSDPATASRALAVLQASYATVYLQAGVSKLRNTGLSWADGRTLRGSWAECGTPIGRHLGQLDRRLAAAASVSALAFELGFAAFTIASARHRRLAGLGSLSFHAMTKLTLGISFWHQACFAVPLFVMSPQMATQISTSCLGFPQN